MVPRAVLLAWVCSACGKVEAEPSSDADSDVDTDGDSDADTDSDTGGDTDTGPPPLPGAVDVLFVVDTGNAMGEEQGLLTEAAGAFVDALLASGQLGSLHIGVTSGDLGAADAVSGCVGPGDDGALLHVASGASGCNPDYPRWLDWSADAPDASIGTHVSCVTSPGTAGCGWEQPFAAAGKAIGVQSEPGGANGGFLRPGAVLAVVFIDDEDDCSVGDPQIYEEMGALNLRCHEYPAMLLAVADTASSLHARARPDRLVVGAVTGIPPDLLSADWDAILADTRMQERVDVYGASLEHACDGPSGPGYPGRRFVELARAVEEAGGFAALGSTCAASYAPALGAVADGIAAILAAE